jgi:23S rRNA pseudouridine1911/1915/1917 synthase
MDPLITPPADEAAEEVTQAAREVVEIVARCRLDNVRLDQYLAGAFPDFSRSVVRRVIDAGGVHVNGKPAKASYRVRHGDHIRIEKPEPTHPLPVAEDIPLEVLYEDEHLAAVNKPADMVVHPAKGH